jgi:phosphatidylinositol alpha-1,6-mannosyltransferase
LVVTNDFPPQTGGIQSYLYELCRRLDPERIVVHAPRTPGDREFDARQEFTVLRDPNSLLLPTFGVRDRASAAMAEHGCDAVWFGSSAPLGLLAPALRTAGARRILASTHGHEVGWSMLPGTRQALRRIGNTTDAVTYVSRYARGRIAAAFGPRCALEHLPSGVDSARFMSDPLARKEIRTRHGLGERKVVLCVSRMVVRKGQGVLIAALDRLPPDVTLLLVGDGPAMPRLRAAAGGRVVFAGEVRPDELPRYYAAADVFAMPCRTRGFGLDVEGLGLVFLEAAAAGLPVLAGDSGGAPETVRDGVTGRVVDGGDVTAVAAALAELLARPEMGTAGARWMRAEWTWAEQADKLAALLGP